MDLIDWSWKLYNGSYDSVMTDLNAATDNASFDTTAAAPRRTHAVLTFAAARCIGSPMYLGLLRNLSDVQSML